MTKRRRIWLSFTRLAAPCDPENLRGCDYKRGDLRSVREDLQEPIAAHLDVQVRVKVSPPSGGQATHPENHPFSVKKCLLGVGTPGA